MKLFIASIMFAVPVTAFALDTPPPPAPPAAEAACHTLTQEQARTALTFLSRAQITGQEAPSLMAIAQAIQPMLK